MKITIRDLTPTKSALEFAKFNDIYGAVMIIKGWR